MRDVVDQRRGGGGGGGGASDEEVVSVLNSFSYTCGVGLAAAAGGAGRVLNTDHSATYLRQEPSYIHFIFLFFLLRLLAHHILFESALTRLS